MHTPMPRLVALLAAAAILTGCTAHPTPQARAAAPPATGALTGPFDVVRVVDGDTYLVRTDAGEVSVRHIGIDTPETVDPRLDVPECYGEQASAAAHDLLDGAQVWLEADPTQDAIDRYGRTLAHVWVGQTLVGEALITAGAAREYTYDTPSAHQGQYQDAEQTARAGGAGLWGTCPTTT